MLFERQEKNSTFQTLKVEYRVQIHMYRFRILKAMGIDKILLTPLPSSILSSATTLHRFPHWSKSRHTGFHPLSEQAVETLDHCVCYNWTNTVLASKLPEPKVRIAPKMSFYHAPAGTDDLHPPRCLFNTASYFHSLVISPVLPLCCVFSSRLVLWQLGQRKDPAEDRHVTDVAHAYLHVGSSLTHAFIKWWEYNTTASPVEVRTNFYWSHWAESDVKYGRKWWHIAV